MAIVQEIITSFPPDTAARSLERREELLLSGPLPGPMKLWQDTDPLEVVHFSQEYRAQPFAPPRGLYESDFLRIEWQVMDNRQPFYHRNCDVDELSYQIAGERTLITEIGVVEHRPGEFSRLPVGVAHDNQGRRESHLLFYIPAPVTERQLADRFSKATFPVFEGWQPTTINELITECLGGLGHDVAIQPVDEQLLLEQAHVETERISVLIAPEDLVGTAWLYSSSHVWLGVTRHGPTEGTVYLRHRDADEVQYQISGRRTLVSQRGIVELEPGDLVRIPLGCAYTSISTEVSSNITLLSSRPVPQVAPASKKAEPCTPEAVRRVRGR